MTLGKYVGGGASFGAFGGRADLMDRFDPVSPGAFSHGGTFNNNIISMAAGYTGLTKVLDKGGIRAFQRTWRIVEDEAAGPDRRAWHRGVRGRLRLADRPAFSPSGCGDPHAVESVDKRYGHLWHLEMMLAGQYVTPRGMIALALPHTENDVDGLVSACDRFLSDYAAILPKAIALAKVAAA